MQTRVALKPHGDRYAVQFTRQQWLLISNVVWSHLRTVRTPAYARLLVDAEKEEVLSILDRAEVDEANDEVRIDLSGHDLHVLHAALTRECLNVTSQEEFYVMNDFFVENVRDLITAIEYALVYG
jgi:hypothetical protein